MKTLCYLMISLLTFIVFVPSSRAWSYGEALDTEQAGWFQFVEGGCFELGSRHPSIETANEKPPRWFCVPAFYLGRTEVTQGQFKRVMGYNPSSNPKGESYPVERLS